MAACSARIPARCRTPESSHRFGADSSWMPHAAGSHQRLPIPRLRPATFLDAAGCHDGPSVLASLEQSIPCGPLSAHAVMMIGATSGCIGPLPVILRGPIDPASAHCQGSFYSLVRWRLDDPRSGMLPPSRSMRVLCSRDPSNLSSGCVGSKIMCIRQMVPDLGLIGVQYFMAAKRPLAVPAANSERQCRWASRPTSASGPLPESESPKPTGSASANPLA